MARLPQSFDLSSPASLRSGRQIAQVDTSGLGRGIAALGEAVSDISADIVRERTATEGIAADGGALRETNDFVRTFDQDGDYGTFNKRAEQGLNQIKAKYASKISNPRVRRAWEAEYDRRAETSRNQIADLGERRAREGSLVEAKNGLDGYQSVFANPDASEEERTAARASAEASINVMRENGLLTPAEADKWREDVIDGGDFVFGQRMIERDPSVLTRGSVVDRIIGVESGGNATAKNPNSSATGAGQFIASTWMNMVKQYRPDLAEGRSTQEVLALRNDPAISREMTQNYANENAQFLRNQGIEATDGNTYLAHFLGPRGAAQVLKADPSASVESIVGSGVVNANGFLRGKTAADVRAWADKKMGGSGALPAWYTSQTPERQFQLQNMAAAEESRQNTQRVAEQKAMQGQANDDYRLRIATSDPTLTQQMILDDVRLDNGDKATLVNSFNEKQKGNADISSFIGAMTSEDATFDPFSSDQRKQADGAYKRMTEVAPNGGQAYAEAITDRTGIVPQSYLNDMRAGGQSTDPAAVERSAQAASRISQINPAALARRDGGTEVQKLADDFGYYVNTLNMSPADASSRIAANNDPERLRQRKALEPQVKDFRKVAEAEDLQDVFDDRWLSDPELGFTPMQAAGLQADYLAIAEEQFYATGGDPELAVNRAKQEMKRLYGVTDMTGRPVVMKFPPEKFWPKQRPAGIVDAVTANPYGYAQEQLRAALVEQAPNADASTLQLVSTPQTAAMAKRGEMPAYQVLYRDENGVLQTLMGGLWRPDVTALSKANEQVQADSEARAREEVPDQLDRARRVQSEDGGRAQSLDEFLAGPPQIPSEPAAPVIEEPVVDPRSGGGGW